MASTLAATALVPLFSGLNLWRADELFRPVAQSSCTPSGFPALDAELPGGGWPRGQIVELLLGEPGIGELGLLMPALAATQRTCVWVLPDSPSRNGANAGIPAGIPAVIPAVIPYAPALAQAGIDPSRHLFVRPASAREGTWALEQSLRAGGLGAVLGWLPRSGSTDADFRILRRLHLLAHRCDALVFVLRPASVAAAPSPAPLRLQLAHDGTHLQVRVLKRRGRPLLEPVAVQVHPHRWSRPRAPATQEARPSLLQRLTSLIGGNPPGWAGACPD